MSSREECGTTLILILGVMAIISFIIIRSHVAEQHMLRMMSSSIHSERAQAKAMKKLIESLPLPPSGEGHGCVSAKGSAGAHEIERELCFSYAPEKVDYQKIFSSSYPCALDSQFTGHSLYGFRLTPSAAWSSKTCDRLVPGSDQYRGNFSTSTLILTGSSSVPSVFGATGYCDLSGGVELRGDAVIVCGGDLHVSSLFSSRARSHVGLISASGVVVVGDVGSNIRIRVSAKEGAYLPKNVVFEEHSVWPETYRFTFLQLGTPQQ